MPNYIKILNSPYFSVGSFLFFQQLGKHLHLENYTYQLRILYLVAQLSIIGLNYYLIHLIHKKNGKSSIKENTGGIPNDRC
jgi:hypothetical protein